MNKTEEGGVSLKEFITDKFNALEKSTELARQSMEKRLDGMNEFRNTLKDQSANFISRQEFAVIQKLVYVGLGVVLVLEIVLRWVKF